MGTFNMPTRRWESGSTCCVNEFKIQEKKTQCSNWDCQWNFTASCWAKERKSKKNRLKKELEMSTKNEESCFLEYGIHTHTLWLCIMNSKANTKGERLVWRAGGLSGWKEKKKTSNNERGTHWRSWSNRNDDEQHALRWWGRCNELFVCMYGCIWVYMGVCIWYVMIKMNGEKQIYGK